MWAIGRKLFTTKDTKITKENRIGWMPFPFVLSVLFAAKHPYNFSAMRSFALRALGLLSISSSDGVIGFRFTTFSVALRSSA